MRVLILLLLSTAPAFADPPCLSISGTGSGTYDQTFVGTPKQFNQGIPGNNGSFSIVCNQFGPEPPTPPPSGVSLIDANSDHLIDANSNQLIDANGN